MKSGDDMLRKMSILLIAIFTITAEASIIKKPPAKPVETAYKDLVCTEQDRAHIYEIVNTVAENGKLSLLFRQTYLREMGAQINHVHPLRFLGVIFSDPHLKSCMYIIWGDYFKRSNFLDDLSRALTREQDRGKLDQYFKDFAEEVHVDLEQIRPYFPAYDWENLLLYLIHS